MKRKLNDIVKNKDLREELKEIHAVPVEPISKDDFEDLLKKVSKISEENKYELDKEE
jgi:hypothetical protein